MSKSQSKPGLHSICISRIPCNPASAIQIKSEVVPPITSHDFAHITIPAPMPGIMGERVDSFKPCDWSVGNDYLLPLADTGGSHFSTRYSTITHVVSASKRSRLYFKHYYEYGTTKIRVRQTNYMQHHNW